MELGQRAHLDAGDQDRRSPPDRDRALRVHEHPLDLRRGIGRRSDDLVPGLRHEADRAGHQRADGAAAQHQLSDPDGHHQGQDRSCRARRGRREQLVSRMPGHRDRWRRRA